MQKREQTSYESYIAKQIEKTSNPSVIQALQNDADVRFLRFKEYFEACGLLEFMPPAPDSFVLCLGARLGGEVRALRELGYERSIGVDLHPLSDLVEVGDFQNLKYDDCSFNGVYSNSLDHCYDLKTVLSEAERVLKPEGIMIFNLGMRAGMGEYETIIIESPEEVTKRLPNCDVLRSVAKHFNLHEHGGLNFEMVLRKQA